MRRIVAALAAGAIVALGAATAQAGAADIDYSQTALNIIPSGQQGSVPIPTDATAQAQMYNALTPLFDHVTNADLFSDFKSEQFGLGSDGPGTVEPVREFPIKANHAGIVTKMLVDKGDAVIGNCRQ